MVWRDRYRATPVMTQDIGFGGPIQRTAPIFKLVVLRQKHGELTLIRI
jgi:hypothetical protein